MVKFRFSEPFDFSPAVLHGQVTMAYKAGKIYDVTRECAGKAEAAGKGCSVVLAASAPAARRPAARKKARA